VRPRRPFRNESGRRNRTLQRIRLNRGVISPK
jgi:hypothetical protein